MNVPTEETASNDGHSPRARNRSSSASWERRVSAATLIIPIAVICRLAIMLPSTTNFRILEIAACQLWYYLNDRGAIPPGGIPEDVCKLSGVDKHYASMSSVLAIGGGIGQFALYRLVELDSGSVKVDGVDISQLDLETLRRSISIIPREAVLFPGTVRSNLDPFGEHDDAILWDALKRAHLISNEEEKSPAPALHANRFVLDATIDDDGSNLSVGERSLISLVRALVKKSKILVLDEATASVDYETDKKFQDTIAREFRDQTILCIAHRLHTVIGYDRVCVMDAGSVAELDTPASQQGMLRSMCNQSGINLDDILLVQKSRSST